MKFIETPLLKIGYEEHGNLDGIPVILLHGFPYDIRSWDGVVSKLTDSGNRILVPYLRGYGPTKFLSEQTPRMAQQSAIANDLIDFAGDSLTAGKPTKRDKKKGKATLINLLGYEETLNFSKNLKKKLILK